VNPVFLDTVGLLALWNTSDQWRVPAATAFQRILTAGRTYVTTEPVLLECGNAASRSTFRQQVIDLRRKLVANDSLITLTDEDWSEAWAAYEHGRPGDPGIVDCVSFAVMRRLGLTDAFTNDQHFAASGFSPLF
jgi:predicted nucleic acid-binding protein